jgi:DNA modification methylase
LLKFVNIFKKVYLDPYNGTGTTTKVAFQMNRNYIGIDNSEKYCKIAEKRIIDS